LHPMFNLGIYEDDEAKEIAGYLKDAGIKVDLKAFLDSRFKYIEFLEGRMSELKGELKDQELYERSERSIKAAREVLARGATAENFIEQLALQLDPALNEKKEELSKILNCGLVDEEADGDDSNKRYKEIMKDLGELIKAEGFIDVVLRRNNVQIGTDVGDRLDDPIARIPVNLQDYGGDHRLARVTTILIIMPFTEINVDEFSIALSGELDEDFREDYTDEAIRIAGMGMLINALVENSSQGKMEMDDFKDNCDVEMEENGNILRVDGVSAAKELARVLEKNGIIKMKGDTIKWKK
jgi:hypothetical protein